MSIKVATKGAENVARSILHFLSIIGTIEPLHIPHIIIPIKDKKIVSPRP